MKSRGINLDMNAYSKLKVLATNTAKPMLDIPQKEYETLLNTVTHILHNAWPMTGKRPLKGFEAGDAEPD